jgi:hypothetical protein
MRAMMNPAKIRKAEYAAPLTPHCASLHPGY